MKLSHHDELCRVTNTPHIFCNELFFPLSPYNKISILFDEYLEFT